MCVASIAGDGAAVEACSRNVSSPSKKCVVPGIYDLLELVLPVITPSGLEVVVLILGSPFAIGIMEWIKSERCLCEDGRAMDV